MLAAYIDINKKLKIINTEKPKLKKNHSLIKMIASGICASDISTIKGINPMATYPRIPGHESIGEIISTKGASIFEIGDYVTVFPGKGCNKCKNCKKGFINHCKSFQVVGCNYLNGVFSEYYIFPNSQLIKVRKELQNNYGALIEPFACGIHINNKLPKIQNSKILIIGFGVIGLICGIIAKNNGIKDITFIDKNINRKSQIKKFGFKKFVHLNNKIDYDFFSQEFSSIIDTVSNEKTINMSIEFLKPNGTCVQVGLPTSDILINYKEIFKKELQIKASRMYFISDFYDAMEIMINNLDSVKKIITSEYHIDQFLTAYDKVINNSGDQIKIIIKNKSNL